MKHRSLNRMSALAASIVAVGAINAHAVTIADSQADFPGADNVTSDSKQGINGWTYGYHNFTGNGTYQPGELIAFPDNDGPGLSATDFWNGGGWDVFQGNPPWTAIGTTSVHGNGTNHAGPSPNNDEQWPIRRYTIQAGDVAGTEDLRITWNVAKANPAGEGVTGVVFHNGIAVDAITIGGAGASGDRSIIVKGASVGDTIDIAHLPQGFDTDRNDGADGSTMRAVIENIGVAPPVSTGDKIADSVSEFSGVQGLHNWFYGYYNRTADLNAAGDGVYQTGEFTQFLGGSLEVGNWGDTNHWRGVWDFNPIGPGIGNPEWTVITSLNMHPNDANPGDEHAVIRRWISERSGMILLDGFFNNLSAAGDGTIGHIFLNGVEIDAYLTDGSRTDFSLVLNVNEGDILDFLVDTGPNPGSPGADGADSTHFGVMITAVPEPATVGLALIGLAGLLGIRRRD